MNDRPAGNRWKQSLLRWLLPVLAVAGGFFLVFNPPERVQLLDGVADQYFEDTIAKASMAYATTRLINAGVSVVQESSLQLQPGGVGLHVAAGQVLDPLNDLTEHLSSVLVTSIASLIVQKITYEVAQAFAFQLIGVLLIPIGLLSVWQIPLVLQYRNLLLKVALFLLVVRAFLPLSALMSSHLNQELFFPKIAELRAEIDPVVQDFAKLTTFDLPEIKGLGDLFVGPIKLMGEKGQQLNLALTMTLMRAQGLFENLLAIMGIYLAVFVIQVIFIPVAMFWLLNKTLFILFSVNLPQPVVIFRNRNSADSHSKGSHD